MTTEFMRATGLEVRIASSGQEALEIAGVFHPEIVLCDMRLPDISGLDVLQALRSMGSSKDVVLAIYSAVSERDVRRLERTVTASPVDVYTLKGRTAFRSTELNRSKAAAVTPSIAGIAG